MNFSLFQLGSFTSSVLLAQIRETPHVPQTHGEAHLGQDVLQLAVPGRPAIVLRHLDLWDFDPRGGPHVQGAALVVERLLVREQVSHGLRDLLVALLALRHLAALRHRGGRGSRGGKGEKTERRGSDG